MRAELGNDNKFQSINRGASTLSILELGRKLLLSLPPAKSILAATAAMYVLNQAHMLPKPLSAVVSKALFWPTLPITMAKRIGSWTTEIDDVVLMGGAPFHILLGMPQHLYDKGVRGVVNMCEEYQGPLKKYKSLGMTELRLPTVDHCVPTVEALSEAVQFCQDHAKRGERVYIHCRAGHGRSAAAVLAWMISTSNIPDNDDELLHLKSLNEELCEKRMVRRTLWQKTNVKEFYQRVSIKAQHAKVQRQKEKKRKNKVLGNDKETKEEIPPITVLEEEYDDEFENVDAYSSEQEEDYLYTAVEEESEGLIIENYSSNWDDEEEDFETDEKSDYETRD